MTQSVNTSELTGAALDWAVAKCEDVLERIELEQVIGVWAVAVPDLGCYFEPSTCWTQGGPIMDREGIGASVVNPSGDEKWLGANYKGRFVEYGPTCLIACMRTYVASKLGDEVEIPTELLNV